MGIEAQSAEVPAMNWAVAKPPRPCDRRTKPPVGILEAINLLEPGSGSGIGDHGDKHSRPIPRLLESPVISMLQLPAPCIGYFPQPFLTGPTSPHPFSAFSLSPHTLGQDRYDGRCDATLGYRWLRQRPSDGRFLPRKRRHREIYRVWAQASDSLGLETKYERSFDSLGLSAAACRVS
jgi:hypothetical protein